MNERRLFTIGLVIASINSIAGVLIAGGKRVVEAVILPTFVAALATSIFNLSTWNVKAVRPMRLVTSGKVGSH